MLFKSRLRRSDVPLQVSLANGCAILSQAVPYAVRRLTGCYASLSRLLTLIPLVLVSNHVHAECDELEMVRDAFSVVEKIHPNSHPALLRTDTELSVSESIQQLAYTLKNASVPIVVDDRNRNEHWLNKISKFQLYPEFVESGSLAGAEIYILAPPGTEDKYLKVTKESGLRIVFLKGKCV